MKEGWDYKKLGEVTTKICDGSHNPPKGVEHSEYPMLSSKNIFFDRFDYDSPRYLSEGDFTEENKRTNISDGDVLLTIVGTVGRTCCVTKPFIPFTLQRSVAVLKPQKTIITSRFLMYSLHSLSNIWESEAKGVAQKGVYLKQVSNISIPIPTITEQNDIVCELDLLSGVIEKQKAQLEELDKLAQSIFYDMFGDPVTNEKGWEIKKLKNIVSKIGSGATPRGGNQSYKDEGVSLIRSMNVHNNFFIYDDLAFIDDEQAALLNNVIVESNDVLLNITGASVARCCMVPDDVLPARVNQHVCIIRPIKDLANSIYLNRFFTSIEEQSVLLLLSRSNAATREALPKNLLDNCNIVLPPLSLQKEFAAKIEAIEAMKAKVRLSLKEAETLFNERMDYYFN